MSDLRDRELVADGGLRVGSRIVTVEPFSGRKALALLNRLRRVSNGAPAIMAQLAEFIRAYEAQNSVTMSRAQARFEFPPRRDAETGEVVRPGRFDHLSEDDWAAVGHTVTLPREPSMAEQVAAVFPEAMELAEESVLRVLALVAMPEDDVRKYRGSPDDLDAALDDLADELLDAPFETLIELAVVGGEQVDDQYQRKARTLGGRMGNALRLLGVKQPPREPTPETERPTSSTSSPEPTGGPPTSSSAPTGSSSSASTTAST